MANDVSGSRTRRPTEQRERILAATAELVAKRGYRGTTVELIAQRAGLSNKTFYVHFANREACLLACLDEVAGEARRRICGAGTNTDDLATRVAAGVAAFLDYVVAEPAKARTFLVESMGAGEAALERYERELKHLADCLRPARELAGEDAQLPDILEDSVVGGVAWSVHQRLIAGEMEAIPSLLPRMVKFALSSYVGSERAGLIAATYEVAGSESAVRRRPAPPVERTLQREPGLSVTGRPVRMRPLRSGRAGLPPDLVARDQRERILAALAQTVAEHGYNQTTVARIATAASVSRQTFYQQFDGKEDCFWAAYDAARSRLDSLVLEATLEETDWPDQVAAALRALLAFLAGRPDLARLCFVEAAAVGQENAPGRERDAERLIALLGVGSRHYPGALDPGEGTEEALLGGVVTQITRHIVAGDAERLDSFALELIVFMLTPYLGRTGALEVARRHSAATSPTS
jgi:AcrR family transcriptional regulator